MTANPLQSSQAPVDEYTVEELAQAAGTAVRNIRAYQDRGLIPPPERRGRIGIYTNLHLVRLRVIAQLLARGYTLASIGDLFVALESGHDLPQLVGLEAAVGSPWSEERPANYSLLDLVKLYGSDVNPRWLARACELGVLEMRGVQFRAPSPRLLHAGAELAKAGIPLNDTLEVLTQLRASVERAAEDMVRLVEKHVFDRYGKGLPPREDVPRLAALIWRLRPLVQTAVNAEIARAMEKAAHAHLGERMAYVLEQLKDDDASGPPPQEPGRSKGD